MHRNHRSTSNTLAFMPQKQFSLFCFLIWLPLHSIAASLQQENLPGVTSADAITWAAGLCFVLALFFICMYLMRKMNRFSVTGDGQLAVLGGLSLGTREKIVLLQVGHKQIVLGVTPGGIDALHVLEGDDCLRNEQRAASSQKNQFAQKLQLAMKGGIRDE